MKVASQELISRTFKKSRIRRPDEKSRLLDELTSDQGVFPTYRECLVFAASLGLLKNRRTPFEKSGEPIPWHLFEEYEPLIQLISIASTGDADIIDRQRFGEQLTIFEEYANGGLEAMQQALDESNGNQIEAFSALIRDAALKGAEQPRDADVTAILNTILAR